MNERRNGKPEADGTLPEGTYYVRDLVGLRAFDETGAFVGTVVGVLLTKQQCLEIASGKTPEELEELEKIRAEALAEADRTIRAFERKIRENPGSVPNPEKALKSRRKKLEAAIPKAETFLVPFVSAYVGDADPVQGTIALRNVGGLMNL